MAERRIIRSELLEGVPGVVHGISTRAWGDMSRDNANNRLSFYEALTPDDSVDISSQHVVEMQQIHSPRVREVGADERGTVLPDTDALVTTASHTGLLIKTADCVPLLLAASDGSVVAAVHVGWRGLVRGILHAAFRTEPLRAVAPSEVLCYLAPGIRACHYQFAMEDTHVFSDVGLDTIIEPLENEKAAIHLQQGIVQQLQEKGIPSGNIDVSQYCTACRTDLFYSHRAEAEIHGEILSVIARVS